MGKGAALLAKEKAKELATLAVAEHPSPEDLRARVDFAFFCEWVTRGWEVPAKPAEHHLEWHPHLVTEVDTKCLLRIGGANVDLLAPRGSAKSTVSALFIAWVIGIHTQASKPIQILYISYSLNAARAKSAAIKSLVECPEYKMIFPKVRPGEKWSDQYWSIDRRFAGIHTSGQEEFTMVCSGIAGSITSKRAHLVFFDDPIKSAESIENESVREKTERNWHSVIRPTILEGGRAICLGTRFRPDDIHVTTFTPEKGWIQIEQSAILEDPETGEERSYWEDMWSLKYLHELRTGDIASFSFQYQNKIIRIDSLGLKPEWINYGAIPDSFDSISVGIDLASSLKEKADFTVMTVIGRRDRRYYVLDVYRGKITSNIEKLDQLITLYEEWHDPGVPFVVHVESVAYQASLTGDFTQYVVNQKKIYDMRCVPVQVSGKGDKLQRLRGVSGLFANGLVSFNAYKDLSCVVNELVNFGSTQHDDCADSIVLALNGIAARPQLIAA